MKYSAFLDQQKGITVRTHSDAVPFHGIVGQVGPLHAAL